MVNEGKNQTVNEMAHTLLHHAKLPPSFWDEAVATSVYLLNCSLTKAIDGKTPEEVFTGHKPTVSHLRVFGCVAHVHVPSQKRRTLDSKSQPMIFTSYATRSKGFRFWDPSRCDIVLSRDGIFDEHSFGLTDVPTSSYASDPFPSLELEALSLPKVPSHSTPLVPATTSPSSPVSSSTSIPEATPSTSKDPPNRFALCSRIHVFLFRMLNKILPVSFALVPQ